ncbi:MAG TPA: discoidin domain-containing protein [bacterium]|nr:discoidin domain-containing protein [bacterium]
MKKTIAMMSCAALFTAAAYAAEAQTGFVEQTQFGKITVTTSSTLPPQAGNSYAPGKLMDGDVRTAWVEGAPGDGIGEWIRVAYESPMRINRIYFANGYGKTEKSYRENGRIKGAEISTEAGSFTKTLSDVKGEQTIELPKAMAGKKTRWIKLTIKSVYPGTKYKDTAFAEFRPDLEENNYE